MSQLNATEFVQGKKLQISTETIIDKIRGGLLGQILGNLNGIPHELRYIQEPGNIKNYIPSLPSYFQLIIFYAELLFCIRRFLRKLNIFIN